MKYLSLLFIIFTTCLSHLPALSINEELTLYLQQRAMYCFQLKSHPMHPTISKDLSTDIIPIFYSRIVAFHCFGSPLIDVIEKLYDLIGYNKEGDDADFFRNFSARFSPKEAQALKEARYHQIVSAEAPVTIDLLKYLTELNRLVAYYVEHEMVEKFKKPERIALKHPLNPRKKDVLESRIIEELIIPYLLPIIKLNEFYLREHRDVLAAGAALPDASRATESKIENFISLLLSRKREGKSTFVNTKMTTRSLETTKSERELRLLDSLTKRRVKTKLQETYVASYDFPSWLNRFKGDVLNLYHYNTRAITDFMKFMAEHIIYDNPADNDIITLQRILEEAHHLAIVPPLELQRINHAMNLKKSFCGAGEPGTSCAEEGAEEAAVEWTEVDSFKEMKNTKTKKKKKKKKTLPLMPAAAPDHAEATETASGSLTRAVDAPVVGTVTDHATEFDDASYDATEPARDPLTLETAVTAFAIAGHEDGLVSEAVDGLVSEAVDGLVSEAVDGLTLISHEPVALGDINLADRLEHNPFDFGLPFLLGRETTGEPRLPSAFVPSLDNRAAFNRVIGPPSRAERTLLPSASSGYQLF